MTNKFDEKPKVSAQASTLYVVAIMTSVVVLAFLLYIGWEVFKPINPIDIKQPMKIITKQVPAGTDLVHELKYCRHIEGPAYVYRTITATDGKSFYPLALITSVTKVGCETVQVHIAIPAGFTPGKYKLVGFLEFHPSSLRTVKVPFESEEFEIVK